MTQTTAELVRLPHTGLRTPGDRFRVTSLKQLETARGMAYTATLRRDGKPVATIENGGDGGATDFVSKHPRGHALHLDERELLEYAAACRTELGEETVLEYVLDDLVDEYEWSKKIAKAVKGERAVLRKLRAYGGGGDAAPYVSGTIGWDMLAERLHLGQAGETLMARATPHGDEWWQVWRDGRWQDVTTRPAHAPAAPLYC